MLELNYNELAQLYGLDPVPESVVRLTQLVARQEADLDEIAKVIAEDESVTQRLLRAANPHAKHEGEFAITSVKEALLHTGMSCALLLAMGTPLTLALVKTFNTMLDQKLEYVNPKSVKPFLIDHVLGTIGFSGRAKGRVYLRLSLDGARRIAARFLDVAPSELRSRSEIDDAVGELLNIVTGNFKSNLSHAGLNCRLHTPSVTRTTNFHIEVPPGAGLERMAFTAPNLVLFVDVTVNPWSQEGQ
jgi:CheY-specific phosphatase CheX